MIITIARQCGSGGVSVGHMVAQHYGIPIYDKAALNELAQEKGIYNKYLQQVFQFFIGAYSE